MSITLYGLKACDTCKTAMKALEAGRGPVTFVDIRAEADLAAKVPQWLAAVGAETLVNTRSTTWRGLTDEQKALAQSAPAELLIANPTLVKRPVIEADGKVHVGWSKAVQAALAG